MRAREARARRGGRALSARPHPPPPSPRACRAPDARPPHSTPPPPPLPCSSLPFPGTGGPLRRSAPPPGWGAGARDPGPLSAPAWLPVPRGLVGGGSGGGLLRRDSPTARGRAGGPAPLMPCLCPCPCPLPGHPPPPAPGSAPNPGEGGPDPVAGKGRGARLRLCGPKGVEGPARPRGPRGGRPRGNPPRPGRPLPRAPETIPRSGVGGPVISVGGPEERGRPAPTTARPFLSPTLRRVRDPQPDRAGPRPGPPSRQEGGQPYYVVVTASLPPSRLRAGGWEGSRGPSKQSGVG